MPHLDVPGASLYYETDGPASAPALLLIHAGIANLRMWDPQIPALAHDHFVIRFDTRGFGKTETEDVAFSNRQDALAVLDHLGIPQATLVGCSRGGTIAIDLALESPDRVSGLVVIGSAPSGFPDAELTDTENAAFDAIEAAEAERNWHDVARLEVQLWSFGPHRREEDLDPDFVATAYELNRVNTVHGGEDPTPIPLEPPAYDRLGEITVPALVTVGEYDISETHAQFEHLVSGIPDATGITIVDAAHLPSVERAPEFNRVLVEWLARQDL